MGSNTKIQWCDSTFQSVAWMFQGEPRMCFMFCRDTIASEPEDTRNVGAKRHADRRV